MTGGFVPAATTEADGVGVFFFREQVSDDTGEGATTGLSQVPPPCPAPVSGGHRPAAWWHAGDPPRGG